MKNDLAQNGESQGPLTVTVETPFTHYLYVYLATSDMTMRHGIIGTPFLYGNDSRMYQTNDIVNRSIIRTYLEEMESMAL